MQRPVGTPVYRVAVFKRHFQQYFSYILEVSFIGGETEENHRPFPGH